MRAPFSELPIVLEDVSVIMRGVTILDRIGLEISSGRPLVLIGPNGSGKTTLLRAAMGLLRPSNGRITWGGRTEAPATKRAIVFQRPVMLRRSTAANVRYAAEGSGPVRDARTSELLALVGLKGFEKRPARRLSVGEQQRLALARALARNPDVLFLDEPTASLDPSATKAIEDVIGAVSAQGIKVVMATHDLGEARRLAGEIAFLHHGQIIERGRADDFFVEPKTLEARRFIAGELLV
jgi:tungstate transport system ATP-binding protein